MIDIAIIKENYSRMADEELICLSQQDGKDLSSEAISALYQEFLKRKLDTTIFSSLRAYKAEEHQRHLQNIQESKAQEFTSSIWTYCFEAKAEGKTNDEIFQGLINLGLDDEQSSFVINSLEERAIEYEKAYDNEMLTGGAICAIGIILTVITYSSALNGGTYVIAWGAIIFGAIRFLKGINNKGKFSKILRTIQEQVTNT